MKEKRFQSLDPAALGGPRQGTVRGVPGSRKRWGSLTKLIESHVYFEA